MSKTEALTQVRHNPFLVNICCARNYSTTDQGYAHAFDWMSKTEAFTQVRRCTINTHYTLIRYL
jgi:hypothetical protein